MLGGGSYVSQNKTLPGAYINVVSLGRATSTLGERGSVAIALPLKKNAKTVIEITALDFVKNCKEITGYEYNAKEVAPLREIFCHATKVYVYDLGENGTVSEAINAFEAYEFNILCAYTSDETATGQYITAITNWRDTLGKKCQAVVFEANKPNYEGVINVQGPPVDNSDAPHALTAWVAGAEAGCAINSSCTNMVYDGEYTIITNKTQAELESSIKNGYITFHLVYGEVRLLEDINSLTATTDDKGEDFKSNQTIRVVDQIANDTARLFNTKYLGKVRNNETGRILFRSELVKHRKEIEGLQAIETYDDNMLTVAQGNTKKSVVVSELITPVNAMSQLYMTTVIQ